MPDWHAFLSDAEMTGALTHTPPGKAPNSWKTTLRIIQIYGRTPLTVTDLSEIFSPRISRQAVDVRLRTGVRIIHGRLPQGIQGKYSLEGLLKSKPESLSKRVARSIRVNGLAGAVVEGMNKTGGDVAQAMQVLDFTNPRQKIVLKNRLRAWGLLGKSVVAESLDLIDKLRDSGVPIEEKRRLLAGVKHHTLQIHKGGEDPLFISVQKLTQRANLTCGPGSMRMREIVNCLRRAKLLGSTPHYIDGRDVYYHFVLAKDTEPLKVLAETFFEPQAVKVS